MDGEAFDRLSVQWQRLRERATRRGALRFLLGGSFAAAIGLPADQSEAKQQEQQTQVQKVPRLRCVLRLGSRLLRQQLYQQSLLCRWRQWRQWPALQL